VPLRFKQLQAQGGKNGRLQQLDKFVDLHKESDRDLRFKYANQGPQSFKTT
jgi:hypothetical protein